MQVKSLLLTHLNKYDFNSIWHCPRQPMSREHFLLLLKQEQFTGHPILNLQNLSTMLDTSSGIKVTTIPEAIRILDIAPQGWTRMSGCPPGNTTLLICSTNVALVGGTSANKQLL